MRAEGFEVLRFRVGEWQSWDLLPIFAFTHGGDDELHGSGPIAADWLKRVNRRCKGES